MEIRRKGFHGIEATVLAVQKFISKENIQKDDLISIGENGNQIFIYYWVKL
jgi:hypothetical protein